MLGRRLRRLLIVTALFGLVAAGGALAVMVAHDSSRSTSRDGRATSGYLQARYELERALRNDMGRTQVVVERVGDEMSATCSHVLRGSPSGGASRVGEPPARTVLLGLVFKALEITRIRSQANVRHVFVTAVDRLQWSEGTITRLIHSIVDTEAVWLTDAVPNVCEDMRAWVASGYRALPAAERRAPFGLQPIPERAFDDLSARGYPNDHPERDLLQLLHRYEVSDYRPTGHTVAHLELEVSTEETRLLLSTLLRTERALGASSAQRVAGLTKHQILQIAQEHLHDYTECMKAHGISFPNQSDISGWIRGGVPLPRGVTRTLAERALKECHAGRRRVVGSIVTEPTAMAGSARFAECLRERGVVVKGPSFSGHGPALTITNNPQIALTSIERSCARQLLHPSSRHRSVIEAGNAP